MAFSIRHHSARSTRRLRLQGCLSWLLLGAIISPAADSARGQEATGQTEKPAAAPIQGSPPSGSAPSNAAPPPPNSAFPDLSVPKDADRATLAKVIATAKRARPTSAEQYRQVQVTLRDASNALIKLIEDKNDPMRMQAELDSLSSAAALMVSESSESRDKVLERMREHLESRDELSLADVQTGIVVAFYLEMQPHKTPARDAYAMLEKRLEDDSREEMQALRATLQANIRRLEMLGNKFQIDARAIDGKAIKTEQFAGKFVIVDFFATWCAPCVAELPQLQQYYEKYRDKGLEVITISIDADRAVLDTFLRSHKLPWPVIHDDAEALEDKLQMKFGILSLPTVLLLNKEGDVVSLEARGPELDRLMQRIFEAPTPADEPAKPAAQCSPDLSSHLGRPWMTLAMALFLPGSIDYASALAGDRGYASVSSPRSGNGSSERLRLPIPNSDIQDCE